MKPAQDLKTVKGWDEVKARFAAFTVGRQDIVQQFVKRLQELRVQLAASEFFACHEVYASSSYPPFSPSPSCFHKKLK